MDRHEEFRQRLEATFRQEAADHLRAFLSSLLVLEDSPGATGLPSVLETAYREIHSLKGAAAVVGRAGVTQLCQLIEDFFSRLRKGEARCTPRDLSILQQAVRHLETMLASPAPVPADHPSLHALLAAVQSCGSGNEPPARSNPEPSASFPPPASGVQPGSDANLRVTPEKLSSVGWHAEQLVAARTAGAYVVEELARIRQLAFAARYRLAGPSSSPAPLLAELEPALTRLSRLAVRQHNSLSRNLAGLQDVVHDLSLAPAQLLFDDFTHIVHDLARQLGKRARLETVGGDIQLDRRVLDRLRAPLLHLVRNAIGHGLEPPSARAPKPPVGVIGFALRPADHQHVELSVSDDGVGIDFRQLLRKALADGLVSPEDADSLDVRLRDELLFRSGVSILPEADAVAGRGLGLGIVRDSVRALGGSISVSTRPGSGTSFRILLPLRVAALRGVLVRCAASRFIVPVRGIDRAVRLSSAAMRSASPQPVMNWNGVPIPVLSLASLLHLPASDPPASAPALILAHPQPAAALLVEEIVAEQEFVLQPVQPPVHALRWYLGMTVGPDGGVVPVLRVSDLLAAASRTAPRQSSSAAPASGSRQPRILVAEDAITSRLFLKNLLDASGFHVTAVADGEQAWQALLQSPFDLVLTDVQMPSLDGYQLTRRIRAHERFARLPVVLLTALDSPRHRQLGSDAGADAYLVKTRFDHQQLLDIIARFSHV